MSGKLRTWKTCLGCGKKSLVAPSKPVNLKALRGIKADSPNYNYRNYGKWATYNFGRENPHRQNISVTSWPLVVIQQ